MDVLKRGIIPVGCWQCLRVLGWRVRGDRTGVNVYGLCRDKPVRIAQLTPKTGRVYMIPEIDRFMRKIEEVPYSRPDLLITAIKPTFEQFIALSGIYGLIVCYLYGWRVLPIF